MLLNFHLGGLQIEPEKEISEMMLSYVRLSASAWASNSMETYLTSELRSN